MTDALTAPPPGFVIEGDAPQDAIPAPPEGFEIEASEPQDDSPPAYKSLPPLSQAALEAADTGAALASSGLVGGVGGGLAALGARIKASLSGDKTPDEAAAQAHKWVDDHMVYQPQTEAGKKVVGAVGDALKWETEPFARAAEKTEEALGPTVGGALHTAIGTAGDIASAVPIAGPVGGIVDLAKAPVSRVIKAIREPAPEPGVPSGPVVPRTPQSVSAAAAVPNLEGASPELKRAAQNAKNLDYEALQRKLNAETLPVPDGIKPEPLRKGQASRDDQQISDEINLRGEPDTDGLLSDSITRQNETLGHSMGHIRQTATPDIVQRSNTEHDQAAIDAIKEELNAQTLRTRAKYKALADENGGVMPIDKGAAASNVDQELKHEDLYLLAGEHPVLRSILERLHSDSPMTFADWRRSTQRLSEVQRGGSSAGTAASIIRSQFENMPLEEGAQKLRGMLNDAKAEAKRGFDIVEQNPAFSAVANDNVPKTDDNLHKVGAPSPLANGKFLENYAFGSSKNASPALVSRLQEAMKNSPDFAPTVEAATLNKLRDAAGLNEFDTGNFAHNQFQKTYKGMKDKLDILMQPKTRADLEKLRQYDDDINYVGKAHTINKSNTFVTLARHGALFPSVDIPVDIRKEMLGNLADWGTDIASAHTGPVGYAALKIGKGFLKSKKDAESAAAKQKIIQSLKDAKLKFAQEATAPGSGIDAGEPRMGRATGGRVDHDALVDRLFNRWKAAQKEADATTEPLLKFPDETIAKALRLAQSHPIT